MPPFSFSFHDHFGGQHVIGVAGGTSGAPMVYLDDAALDLDVARQVAAALVKAADDSESSPPWPVVSTDPDTGEADPGLRFDG